MFRQLFIKTLNSFSNVIHLLEKVDMIAKKSYIYYVMKKILLIFMLFLSVNAANAEIFPIDSTKNAQNHNNRGLEYLKEKNYFAAISEFKIALALNPKHQTSATFNYNLGQTYLHLAKLQRQGIMIKSKDNFAKYAEICFETAIKQDCMQFSYYKALLDAIDMEGNLKFALIKYQEESLKNPFAQIMVALIYERTNRKMNAKICLDEFVSKYPNLIITPVLENYLNKL